ncbi:Retrovirus-related Pol polyprotein from transposon TNT 1-94, partial [Linum perenne]
MFLIIKGWSQMEENTSGKKIGSAELVDGLYLLRGSRQVDTGAGVSHMALSSSLSSIETKLMLWHYRLGHASFSYLQKVFPQLFLNKQTLRLNCEICQYAKHTRSVYAPVSYTPTSPFSIIHSDIWGPSRITSLNGTRWFITMIDEHTRMTWTFLMKEKSDASRIFQNFYTMIEHQFQTKIKVLKTDNAKDYFN